MKQKKLLTPLFLLPVVLFLMLSGCGKPAASQASAAPSPEPTATATPAPEPSTYDGPLNVLTGMPISEEWANRRPIAVMINNLKAALPQHGVSQADIIYEVLAEGGITRMLAVYQRVEGVGDIGSVRSSRPYYLELALGLDAVYLHAGGSEDAYAKIKSWGVTALDCVNGPYEGTLYWRDQERIKTAGYEHSVFTSGDTIINCFKNYSFRMEHKAGYTYQMEFADDGTPVGGESAHIITVPYSYYKTGVFSYDEDDGRYLVEEYDKPYVDGNTGGQVSVTNVVILKTACKLISGDEYGHLTVDLTSGGEGYFACGGKIIPIKWSKADKDSQFVYKTLDGKPVTFGKGPTYVNIIPLEKNITVGK